MMYVKPATPDLKVSDPERGGHLPASGDEVPSTEYWRRRLTAGDVIDATPPRTGKAKE